MLSILPPTHLIAKFPVILLHHQIWWCFHCSQRANSSVWHLQNGKGNVLLEACRKIVSAFAVSLQKLSFCQMWLLLNACTWMLLKLTQSANEIDMQGAINKWEAAINPILCTCFGWVDDKCSFRAVTDCICAYVYWLAFQQESSCLTWY